jgi:similar to stage IV sporulation protein
LLSYIRGYYTIIIEGIGIEQFLNHLKRNGICVYDVKRIKNTSLEFKVDRRDLKGVKELYRGSNFEIKIKQKTGIPFLAKRIYKYKAMWICAIISLAFLMGTSQFVTDVYIQTPEGIKKEELRKEFSKAGVRPGVYKKSIDRKEVRDTIMSKFDDVAYVSINVKGTNIFVTVTKKAESLKSTDDSNYCNIIALKNGIIEKVIPRSGRQIVQKGDIVQKGAVLLNGSNNRAIPEVWASTFYESKKSANYINMKKTKTGEKKKVRTYMFYDKKLTFRKKIKYRDYIVENSEKKLSIGNYTFPLKIRTSIFYETRDVKVKKNQQELKKELSKKALKELEYMIPVSARIVDVKHSYKINKNILEYVITVQTSENIAKVYPLSKAEAEKLIKEQNKPKEDEEGQEEIPSNPEKRPINDIRNEFEEQDKEKDKNSDNKGVEN